MKALSIISQNHIQMQNVPEPALEPDEILCRVVYSGICGTDLVIYTGETNFVKDGLIKYPVRIGHEWSGYVEKTGIGVTKFKTGDRVVSDNGITCRKCAACLLGDMAHCEHSRSVGTIDCWEGSFAEYIVIPECHLYHLPDSINYKKGAMIEPLTVAYAGMIKYPITAETTVAVIGTGPIGMSALAIAQRMGAKSIVCIGRTDVKLEVAKKLGATHTININKADTAGEIARITGGKGIDFTVETSGAPSTVQQAIDITRTNGFIAMIGFYEINIDGLVINRLVTKGLTMRGIMGELGIVPPIIKYITESGLDLLPMVTNIIDFDDAVSYFENHREAHKKDIKVLVKITEVDE